MTKEKLKVDLCHDHFQRVVEKRVCHTCPSAIENEAAVMALAKLNDAHDDDKLRAIISETQSIRRAQSQLFKQIEKIDHTLHGNGKAGMQDRLTIMETRLDVTEKNKTHYVAIGTAIIAAIIALIPVVFSK